MSNYVLTSEGIRDLDGNTVDTPFDGREVSLGDFGEGQFAVIVDRQEIWVHNGTWNKLCESDLKLNCLLWTGHGLLVGTDKARLAWANEDGLQFIENFDNIESRSKWSTPGGGDPDVRSMAIDHSNGTIYVNIHVGWIVKSTDGGVTWEPKTEGLEKDVHMVNTHPTEEGIVFAATARGFHLSMDFGESFTKRWEDMPQRYQRATAWYPDQDIVLVTASNGPHSGNAHLYRSVNRGDSWEKVEGLPDSISKNINTYQLTLGSSGGGYVIIEYSDVYETDDHGETWKLVNKFDAKSYQVVQLPHNL